MPELASRPVEAHPGWVTDWLRKAYRAFCEVDALLLVVTFTALILVMPVPKTSLTVTGR